MRCAVLCLLLVVPMHLLADDDDKLAQALKAAKENNSQQAVTLLSELIKEKPDLPEAYYFRGREQFRLGEVVYLEISSGMRVYAAVRSQSGFQHGFEFVLLRDAQRESLRRLCNAEI